MKRGSSLVTQSYLHGTMQIQRSRIIVLALWEDEIKKFLVTLLTGINRADLRNGIALSEALAALSRQLLAIEHALQNRYGELFRLLHESNWHIEKGPLAVARVVHGYAKPETTWPVVFDTDPNRFLVLPDYASAGSPNCSLVFRTKVNHSLATYLTNLIRALGFPQDFVLKIKDPKNPDPEKNVLWRATPIMCCPLLAVMQEHDQKVFQSGIPHFFVEEVPIPDGFRQRFVLRFLVSSYVGNGSTIGVIAFDPDDITPPNLLEKDFHGNLQLSIGSQQRVPRSLPEMGVYLLSA